MPTLAQRLAGFAAGLRFEDLPPPVVHEAKRRIIDSLGCALGAWNAEPCGIARRIASRFPTEAGATLLGTALRAPPDWAAFANGCLVRYLDFNDTYLSREPAHPSDNIPAALAVAETETASGRELITAIVLAYEIQCRLCDAVSLRARGWDHVTYVAFSSALAAARLMRLDARRTEQAVNIAGVSSASLRQSRAGALSHWKGCTVAHAARRGVFAALLAREGMTGPAPIFEGEFGFEKLVAGQPLALDIEDWSEFMMLRTSMKFWPAEYHAQSAIAAALELRRRIGDAAQIESVLVRSHDAAVEIIGSGLEKWRPASRETADHSLPYMVAVALADGEVTERQFAPARFADEKLLDLLRRVAVERDAELTALYPEAVANIVTARTRDGRTHVERCDFPPGNAKNPLSDSQVETKFRALAEPLLGTERAARLLRGGWGLEAMESVHDLLSLTEITP
jgi:2-methylcitrate dehydratase